jgi:hypothetical protein
MRPAYVPAEGQQIWVDVACLLLLGSIFFFWLTAGGEIQSCLIFRFANSCIIMISWEITCALDALFGKWVKQRTNILCVGSEVSI